MAHYFFINGARKWKIAEQPKHGRIPGSNLLSHPPAQPGNRLPVQPAMPPSDRGAVGLDCKRLLPALLDPNEKNNDLLCCSGITGLYPRIGSEERPDYFHLSSLPAWSNVIKITLFLLYRNEDRKEVTGKTGKKVMTPAFKTMAETIF